jgi:hypothetical protein
MEFSTEVLQRLGEAFSDEEVEFLPRAQSGGKAMALPYIDARNVMRRLDQVVGPGNWSFDFDLLSGDGKMVRGRLTVLGVTKCDAGEGGSEDEVLKSAVSDALKRAAVHFGIGRYLYHLPRVWAPFDAQKRRFTEPPQISRAAIDHAVRLALAGSGPAPTATHRGRSVDTNTGEVIEEPAPAPAPESSGDRRVTERAPSAAGPEADKARAAFHADLKKLVPSLGGKEMQPTRHWLYGLLLNKDRTVDPAGWPAEYWDRLHGALRNAVDEQKLGGLIRKAQDRAVSTGTLPEDPFNEENPAQATLPAQARGA